MLTPAHNPMAVEGLSIRLAAPAQAALASEILGEAARWLIDRGQGLWDLADLQPGKLLPRAEAGELWLAWLGAHAVATMLLQPEDPLFWPDEPPGEALYVHKLAVRREVAGHGLSGQLLAHARARAITAGRRYLRLDTDATRPALCRLYAQAGFAAHSQRQVGRYFVTRFQMALPRPERARRSYDEGL